MLTAKIFQNGRSQAVRLPKEYRFNDTEVLTHKVGDVVMLFPKSQEDSWNMLLTSLDLFSEDFMADGRNTVSEQERDVL
ncbi:type II toxin-antitoxin system antitoxin VapB [Selenomonas ruminantium]|uniref:Antitoxin VapB n=1 Tax=Selenomonas ruminantium TaxID=971 RepID=A0A1H0NZ03_SELRU|nr:AbrB/MazE/SpoVT family DNA-binding domain-containing protein [Selenomonas ruminantium]SDO97901.1 antitoxin VapB [Selenomonas ruminantium]